MPPTDAPRNRGARGGGAGSRDGRRGSRARGVGNPVDEGGGALPVPSLVRALPVEGASPFIPGVSNPIPRATTPHVMSEGASPFIPGVSNPNPRAHPAPTRGGTERGSESGSSRGAGRRARHRAHRGRNGPDGRTLASDSTLASPPPLDGSRALLHPPPAVSRAPPLRTPSGGGLPRPGTGTSATYARAKHAQLTLKDLALARTLMESEIRTGGESARSALKDLVCILKQQGAHAEATRAILAHRDRWSNDARMQESLDNMLLDLYKHARDLEGQIVVTGHLIAYSRKALAEGRTGWMIRTAGCKNTVSVHRRLSTLYRLRGQAEMQSGRWADAEASLTTALAHERSHTDAEDMGVNIDLAACRIAVGKPLEARDVLVRVAESASTAMESRRKSVGGSSVGTARRVGLALAALTELLGRFAAEAREVADHLERTAAVVNALDGEAKSEDERRAKSEERSRRANVDEANADEANADEAKADEANVDEANVDEANADEANVDDALSTAPADSEMGGGASGAAAEASAAATAAENAAVVVAAARATVVAAAAAAETEAATRDEDAAAEEEEGSVDGSRFPVDESASRTSAPVVANANRHALSHRAAAASSRNTRREGDSMWMEQVLLPAVEFFWRSRPVARVDILEDTAEETGAPRVLFPGVPPVPAAPPGVVRAVGDAAKAPNRRIAAAPVSAPADPATAEATLPEASLDMVASIRQQQRRHDETIEAMRRREADAEAAADAATAAANGGAALSMHDQILVAADQRRELRRHADAEPAAEPDRGLRLGLGMEATVQRQAAVEEGSAELPLPTFPSLEMGTETRASTAAPSAAEPVAFESLRKVVFEAPVDDEDAMTVPLRNIRNLAPNKNAGVGATGGDITSPVDLLF